jgi:hypothetical protein
LGYRSYYQARRSTTVSPLADALARVGATP